MYKKFLIPALIISIISNGVLGYYLHITLFDLKCAEDIKKHQIKEIIKLKEQNSKLLNEKYTVETPTSFNNAKIPDGYEIEYTPLKNRAKNRVKNRTLPNIYIPQRAPEPYIPTPYIQTPAYIPEERQRDDLPTYTYNQQMRDHNLIKAAEALDGINTNMTINGIFPKSNIIYLYPEY